jgi:hypothetical protein
MTEKEQPRGVHLVGSVPLSSNEEVFRNVSTTIGNYVHRIPDGETGIRSNWIGWQLEFLMKNPAFDFVPPSDDYASLPGVKLKADFDPANLKFDDIGYAKAALASYAEFARLKSAGQVAAQTRFQVSLPTPLATVNFFVNPEAKAIVEPAYEARMLEELKQICDAVPHNELAIQWDVAVEFAILEGVWPTFLANPREDIIERLVRIGNAVPAGVELGYHLCYGDAGHQHFKQPEDTSLIVDIANAVSAGVKRPLNWIHLPVPRDRSDVAYFSPLQKLKLQPETELYLGLVHYTDGVEGTRQRIAAARQVIPEFGVATECGMGRRKPETIPDLLKLHTQVANPL